MHIQLVYCYDLRGPFSAPTAIINVSYSFLVRMPEDKRSSMAASSLFKAWYLCYLVADRKTATRFYCRANVDALPKFDMPDVFHQHDQDAHQDPASIQENGPPLLLAVDLQVHGHLREPKLSAMMLLTDIPSPATLKTLAYSEQFRQILHASGQHTIDSICRAPEIIERSERRPVSYEVKAFVKRNESSNVTRKETWPMKACVRKEEA
jgi:hypothetical protein